jgi:hypothetical protein
LASPEDLASNETVPRISPRAGCARLLRLAPQQHFLAACAHRAVR